MRVAALSIRTPEGIVFSQPLAGPVSRFLAWAVDAACVAVAVSILSSFMTVVGFLSPNIATALGVLGYFVISIGYGMTLEWLWRGQTLGKRLLGLRVVDAEGMRLQFHQVVTRNLLRFVDNLPAFYFVGGLTSWLNQRGQRLGDIAGNTVVIRIPRIAEPDLEQLLAGKFNSFRRYPHLAARLRQRTSPGEASVALQAILRRDEFEPVARLELFADLATHFRGKVEFPSEATDGLADEQFIRNIADLIYRSGQEGRSKGKVPA
ncbi:MAG TPA: RDD family protein [Candidatus Limnocylindria bacterium]|jgi:uncharacterized RDD family membrane protein YckC|nr:RDD family protein [Candidatus Limnocylindria bacterium]